MAKYICTADWHLKKAVPVCRTETEEEWFAYQFKIIYQILDLCEKYESTLLIAGDLFDRAVPGQKLINTFLLNFKNLDFKIIAIAGNHDLPYHNFNLINESAFDTLTQGNIFDHSSEITEHHFNTEKDKDRDIVICHHLCFPDKKSIPPNVNAYIPDDIFDMYPTAKYIICGDYHQGHVTEKDGRFVIVPGCTTIQAADLINYDPKVYLLDTNNNTIEAIKLTNNKDNISNLHITEQNERDTRIDEFIDSLVRNKKISLDFVLNVKRILETKIDEDVKKIIIQIMEEI